MDSSLRTPEKDDNGRVDHENKSVTDIVITVAPIYVTSRTPKLKKGEAIDHPVAPR